MDLSEQALRETLADGFRDAKVSPPRSMRQFAEREIIITDGRYKGQRWDVSRQPVAGLWFDAIDSGEFTEFVCTAPSQFGKTLMAFVVPLLYHTCEIQENYVLGVPYADMAANKFEIDIAPSMRASSSMRKLLPRHGSGSGGGRVRDSVTLANGNVVKLASAGAGDGGKAGFTARVVGITEAGQFSDIGEASEEADPLRQLRARQRSYPEAQRRTYIEGTLTRSHQLPFRLRINSSQSEILAKHKACENWISCERDHLSGWHEAKSENEAARAAFWACPACGEKITDKERHKMLMGAKLVHAGQSIDAKGKITGPKPDTTRLWFRCSAWHNMFLSAGDIARDEWKAAQISEDSPERISAERELCQFVWCIPWDPAETDVEFEIDKKAIGRRRLTLPRAMVTADTVSLTVGIDLGSKAGWYLALAKRSDGSFHVPDYDRFDVPSDSMSLDRALISSLTKLREYLMNGYAIDGGGIRTPDEIWYDAGYQSKTVTKFVRLLSGTRRNAIDVAAYGRGTNMIERGTFSLPKKKTQTIRQIDPGRLWFMERDLEHRVNKLYWDADATKYEILQALTLQQGTPGSITLYSGIDKIHERFQRHVTNEPLERVKTATGETMKFVRKGDNHLLDALANAWRATSRYAFRVEKLFDDATKGTTPQSSSADWYGDRGEKKSDKQANGWYDED